MLIRTLNLFWYGEFDAARIFLVLFLFMKKKNALLVRKKLKDLSFAISNEFPQPVVSPVEPRREELKDLPDTYLKGIFVYNYPNSAKSNIKTMV
ncbi:MAG: hypothetical protein V1838_04155 [Patescibacteria group bacterium]